MEYHIQTIEYLSAIGITIFCMVNIYMVAIIASSTLHAILDMSRIMNKKAPQLQKEK